MELGRLDGLLSGDCVSKSSLLVAVFCGDAAVTGTNAHPEEVEEIASIGSCSLYVPVIGLLAFAHE